MLKKKSERIVQYVKKFYSEKKAKMVENILLSNDWEDVLQHYLLAKTKLSVATAKHNSKNQTERCVAFLRDNKDDEVVNYFVSNQSFKPAGLNTTVQLAYLCQNEWHYYITQILELLEEARTTKITDRKAILNSVGSNDSPLLYLHYLLTSKLALNLFETQSTYYNGYNIKKRDVYDKQAESA